MALVVNSNIPSYNAQRNLQRSTSALTKSLERLSSGMRINRAGDDAAGLAISESLRSQVRGLQQAVRNSNDGISMVQTAEGAIQEVSNILQRMRELAVQAASDTNSADNRAALQLEIDELVDELTRISNTVQFNGRNLLDGTFADMKLQTGAQSGQTIDLTINDLRATTLGAVAKLTSGAPTANLVADDLLINGESVPSTENDGVSFADKNFSAIAMVNAINQVSSESGVTAKINENEWTAPSSDVEPVTLDGTTTSLTINGVNIGALTVSDDDSDNSLREAINAVTNQTGVEADVNASGELVLSAKDGRNITVTTTGSIGDELGFVGANGDMDQTIHGTYDLISDETIAVSGNDPDKAGISAGATSVDPNTAINTIEVTNHDKASEAIEIIDYAFRQVNKNRAELGAITNRLEMTISNLQTIAENLQASDSRIRDTDFAAETAILTRNQILQQAGVAILAQANVTPQAALSLLQ